jgi:hypothetical protein
MQFTIKSWFLVFNDVVNPSDSMTFGFKYTLIVILSGLFLWFKNISSSLGEHKYILLSFILLIFNFTILSHINLFPLGPTRHSFILQIPLVFFFFYPLLHYRIKRIFLMSIIIILVVFGAIYNSNYLYRAKNNIDFKELFSLLNNNPNSVLIDIPEGLSWDQELLIFKHPELRNRIGMSFYLSNNNQSREQLWQQVLINYHSVYLISRISPINENRLRFINTLPHVKFTIIKSLSSHASCEVSIPYGPDHLSTAYPGNAYYLYRVDHS